MNKFSVFVAKPSSKRDYYLKHAPEFYRTFTHDERFPVSDDVVVLRRNFWSDLLEEIYTTGQRRILIVAHGTVKAGLNVWIGLHRRRAGGAPWARMMFLLNLLLVREAHRRCKDSKRPQDWYEVLQLATPDALPAGSPEQALDQILQIRKARSTYLLELREAVQKARSEMVAAERTSTSADQLERLRKEYAEKEANAIEFVKNQIEECFERNTKLLGLNRDQVDDYLDRIEAVQGMGLERVEIRGCNLKNKAILYMIALFLNAKIVPRAKSKGHLCQVSRANHPHVYLRQGSKKIPVKDEAGRPVHSSSEK